MRLPLGGALTPQERQILEQADKQNAKRNREVYFEKVFVKNADNSDRELKQAEFVADSAGVDIAGLQADIDAIRDALVAAGLMKSS